MAIGHAFVNSDVTKFDSNCSVCGGSVHTDPEIIYAGWVHGNFDGFVGKRIYPSWSGAKVIPMRDVRILPDLTCVLHDPWKNLIVATFASFAEARDYVEGNGTVQQPGANVWD